MSETSDKIRKLFKAGDDIRDAGLKEPEDVEKYRDIRYGTEDPMQVMDVYRPAGQEGLSASTAEDGCTGTRRDIDSTVWTWQGEDLWW